MTHGAFILARYSTENQDEDSIEVQVQRCTDWCSRQGLPVLDIFADYAVSGMKDTRPQLERMLEALRRGGADTVVVYDQSRAFRKLESWFRFRSDLDAIGVRVASVTQPTVGGDLRDPANFLMEGSMALFNQLWVLQSRQKTVEKMRYMARNGIHTGGFAPYGYAIRDKKLVICPEEADIVREIFQMYASGHSYAMIARELNDRGIVTRRGNRWGKNSLHDILSNRKYIGILVYGKTSKGPDGRRNGHKQAADCIELPDGCPAIISRELWDRVHAALAARRHTGGPIPKKDYRLHNRVFCACGSAMSIEYKGPKGSPYAYYQCCSGKRSGDCSAKNIRADYLEEAVAQQVRARLGTEHGQQELLDLLFDQRDRLQGSAGARMANLVSRHKRVSAQLENAINAVLEGLNSPALSDKIKSLENELAGLSYQMDSLHGQLTAAELNEAQLRQSLAQLLEAPDNDAFLAIVYAVQVLPDTIRVWTMLDISPDSPTDPRSGPNGGNKGMDTRPKFDSLEAPGTANPANDSFGYNRTIPIRRTNSYTQLLYFSFKREKPSR